MKKGQVENGKEKAKKIKNKKQKENRKRKRKAEICSVKKDVAAGDCWWADAGTEDVDNRKALCPVKKADGRALAGQAGRKVID